MPSSSSTETPLQLLPLISEPPFMNCGKGESGDAQSRETGGGRNLDFPISTNGDAHRFADESHSANPEDEVLQIGKTPRPSMSFFQGSSNVKIDNSNFNEIHGNATIIRFGDGEFTEVQRNIICDYIGNLTVLPDIGENLKRINLIQAIQNLPHAEAVFNDYQTKKKSGPCFEGTRLGLLREMADWVTGKDESRMYILSGLAGIGKSTVAYTIASRAANLNLLGASFFFSRDENDRKNAKKFFTTIAYQLCLYDETFAKAIGDVLQADGGSAVTKCSQEQLQALIVDPLHSIVQSRSRPILLVVDALDECDEEDALSVLTGLKQLVRALPSFKVILTTRPQPRLDRFFGSHDGHQIFHLQDIENKVVDGDIRLYLNHMLSLENVQECVPTSQWCAKDKEVDALVRAAGRLFIIASTVVRIILDKIVFNPKAQMKKLLGTFGQDRMPFKDLNEFYNVILWNIAPADCDNDIVNRYQSVVGAIIFVQHPLPVAVLAHLIDRDVEEIRAVLVNLRSVILLGDDDIPRIYHKSFPDYITDSKLCQDIKLRIDPIMHHIQITISCFQIMDKHLKRNILDLGVPARFMINEDGLKADGITEEQMQKKIPQHLCYACVFWVNHLEVTNMVDEALMNVLERFAYEHMLYWLEVLSLIGKLDSAHRAISVVLKLLMSTSSDLHQLLSDALRFISKFYEIIERSALHTYYSALPFTPTTSLLYHRYIKETEDSICSIEGGPEEWDVHVANLRHEGRASITKFSLDSTLLVTCNEHTYLYPGQLKIWDAATGIPISTIPGHRFAIANDFSTVASSRDNIAMLCNVNGSPSGTGFTTSSMIQTLAFSAESSRVAAGLSDGTVWLWDSGNAELIDCFDGFVVSPFGPWLEFSPTGARLAYLSANSVKLRDGASGRFITDLQCGSVQSALVDCRFKFSGDGSRMASNPLKLTLWNSESGELIAAVRDEYFTSQYWAISANGSLLATASSWLNEVTLWNGHLAKTKVIKIDKPGVIGILLDNIVAITTRPAIKLYNVKTHSFIHTLPFGGISVPPTFSPDCTRLAVNDYYGNVNLWEIRDLNASSPPSQGDATAVTALALSRDCSRLACGFEDGTVQLWGTTPTMRQIVLGSTMERLFLHIFRHFRHTKLVRALAFDPDSRLFVSWSDDMIVKLWNGRDGVLRGTLKVPGELKAVALSNSVLVTARRRLQYDGQYSGGVTLWSLDTLRHIHTFETSDDTPSQVSIAENSTVIAVSFDNSRVTLFDVVNLKAIHKFNFPPDINTLTFLPDNSQLMVQSRSGNFQSFNLINLINNHTTQGPVHEHLVQLPNIPLWHGIPVLHWEDEGQHYFSAVFSQYKNPVPVLWIPRTIHVMGWTQGLSMIALRCLDGRVILIRLRTSNAS